MYRGMQLAVGQTACAELPMLRHVILYTSVTKKRIMSVVLRHVVSFPLLLVTQYPIPCLPPVSTTKVVAEMPGKKQCWRDLPLVGLVVKGSRMIVRTIWISLDDSFRAEVSGGFCLTSINH